MLRKKGKKVGLIFLTRMLHCGLLTASVFRRWYYFKWNLRVTRYLNTNCNKKSSKRSIKNFFDMKNTSGNSDAILLLEWWRKRNILYAELPLMNYYYGMCILFPTCGFFTVQVSSLALWLVTRDSIPIFSLREVA